jgi:peptidyl-prolyl cis-trans isomerase SurA
MRRFVPALALCVPLVLCGVEGRAPAKVIERIVAVINDDIVLDSEVEQVLAPQLQRLPDLENADQKKQFDEMKRKGLDQLIESRLIGQQAKELKLTVTNDEVDRALEEVKRQNKLDDSTFAEALKQQGFTVESYKKSLKKQILELNVVNTAVRSRVQVSDDEVKTYYQQNARQLNGQSSSHLRQILIAVPPDASDGEVERLRKKAAHIAEDARAGGGKNFGELAKKYSDDDLTKGEGGDLGEVGPGVLQDALDQAVAGMEANDVRGPIRTGRGWHVLQLVERKAAPMRPYDEVKEQIRKQLYDQQVEKASQAWIRELRKKAHVDIRL